MEESGKAKVDQEECMESGRSSETFGNKIEEVEAVEGDVIWDIFRRQEAESFDADYFEKTPARTWSASKRRPLNDGHRLAEVDGVDSIRRLESHALKACKIKEDLSADNGYTTFTLFASLLDSTLQGLMPIPDLILQFERSCRNVSESIRYESNIRHRVVEEKLMRQRAQLLLDEGATWSLLWYLYGKGNESLTFENFWQQLIS
ncbi:hypothetical protein REPUB_Repub05bG0092500 [Reevesia pubescens]